MPRGQLVVVDPGLHHPCEAPSEVLLLTFRGPTKDAIPEEDIPIESHTLDDLPPPSNPYQLYHGHGTLKTLKRGCDMAPMPSCKHRPFPHYQEGEEQKSTKSPS
ncbi:hypothetical protein AMTR_s00023p00145820 [Amborella trichopoda]|uniref:Uncharacterized protein n=1 Tax=Amborella trichopoda TaxID=13333 RepID=W1NIL4_AMBTC|nr:hypothetical protein AMTR_s00023p00145820 [Amborella trichopoda]